MKAVISKQLRRVLSWERHNLGKIKETALEFVRSGKVDDVRLGLCTNLDARTIIREITKTSYPIKGKVWENPDQVYARSAGGWRVGEKYKGKQLKQRRKLAIKLINVIDQFLGEQRES